MKDKLENFIRENKQNFETELPRENLWLAVELELKRKKKSQLFRMYSVAASLAVIMVASVLLIRNTHSDPQVVVNVAEQNKALISDTQIDEVKVYYSSLIEVKRTEIDQYRKTQPELVKQFEFQLQELNTMYKELVPQIKDENKKEIVLQALISNLQLQLQILTKQLEIIQKVNEKKNEKNILL